MNPQSIGPVVARKAKFWQLFGRSRPIINLQVTYHTFGKLKPEIAQAVKDITNPNAITEMKVTLGIGKKSIFAHYTRQSVVEAIEQFNKK